MQLAVIEFARNMLGWEDAQSSEFMPETSRPVVVDMPEHNSGQMGGTMRLGKRTTVFKSNDSILSEFDVSRYTCALCEATRCTPSHEVETFCFQDALSRIKYMFITNIL